MENVQGKVVVITGTSSGLGGMNKFYRDIAVPADSFARAVAFAISQPEEINVNEILFRPTRQEL